jgi:hypothetical protein
MEDFDFLGDGSGSQSAPKSKFERDLEKFGDMSKLKDAKKEEEDRLRQAGKFYDISEKENTDIPLPKPDSLKRRGNIDRDDLITSAVPTLTDDDDDTAQTLSPADIAAAEMAAEEAAEEAAKLAAQAVAALENPMPTASYAGAEVKAESDDVIVVKNDDDDEPETVKTTSQRVVDPRQDNGLPTLTDLSDEWLDQAAKSMGYADVILSEREKEQLRLKENSKIATNLEKSLKEKTRVSTSEYTENKLKSAKGGRNLVFICAGLCILLGVFSYFFIGNTVIRYVGAALVVFGALTFIKIRFLSKLLKIYLFVCLFAYIFAGLLSEMYASALTDFGMIAYTAGVVVCLTVLGILSFTPSVVKYYRTNFREAEMQI